MLNFIQKPYFLIGGIIVIIFLAFLLSASGVFLSSEQREQRELIDEMKRLGELEANDIFGGTTPEETLELFTAALEAGDIELASRYFVVGEREELRKELHVYNDGGYMNELIDAVGNLTNKSNFIEGDDTRFLFEHFNEIGTLDLQISLEENQNNIWKITDL